MTEVNSHGVDSVAGGHYSADTLPVGPPPANHGRTGAGWTLFAGGVVGALVVAIGFILPSMPLIYAGIAVAVVGVIASIILRAAGYGQVQRVTTRQ